ncbi:JAB domain-containing protein [Acidocella aminolytica]|uniref:DNA repair protein RadC n=1 Tax=Acidocella aminolytica 101 = DSM 11237 TaxID=1120923 RepID=A0A0D6PD12_9PROT|nr:JAB domain-containing protein [Acidocella aminolytica]GAN78749.1 DNA repair protein RadC [Acidocella aminolytica 101 = DSM 11237]SHE79181.1 RadC-like JAB domain-containing protein [Acidocella aminolytica 101 = DSM 11237]
MPQGFAKMTMLEALSPEIRPAPLSVGADVHRARLRGRSLPGGPDALADHELIEMTLFLALPRRDIKPIARALLARFGSYANAISAPVSDFLGVEGLREAGVSALKLVQAAGQRLPKAEVLYRPVLSNWDRLMEYLQAVLVREKVEQFRVLYLDNRNRLLADVPQATGTGEPHAGLPARGGQARVGAELHGVDSRA